MGAAFSDLAFGRNTAFSDLAFAFGTVIPPIPIISDKGGRPRSFESQLAERIRQEDADDLEVVRILTEFLSRIN